MTTSNAMAIRHTSEEFQQLTQAYEAATNFVSSLSFNITYDGNNKIAKDLCNELASRTTVKGPITYCILSDTTPDKSNDIAAFSLSVENTHFGEYKILLNTETPQGDIEKATRMMDDHIVNTYNDLFLQASKMYLEHIKNGEPATISLEPVQK